MARNFNRVKFIRILDSMNRLNRLANREGFISLGYLLVCLDRLTGAHGMFRDTSLTYRSLCASSLLVCGSLSRSRLRLWVET